MLIAKDPGGTSNGVRNLLGRLRRRRQRPGDAHTGVRPADCIFCRQDDPEINTVMCENESFYARYDNFPANPGHVEIVPKRHVESFFDLDEREVVSAYALLREAKLRLDDKYFPEAYTIGVNEGKAAGRSIDHLHIHLIPRHHGDVDDPRGGIRRAAPNCDPDAWR
ncbi:HIT family protein [Actinomadura rayongensis]|uniref:HIT domain-containing protein n=1 Tax=Actinomadura rayongensis TaxID=1429076 RepID=A0A6I4W2T1_9ACTN|nr:HIT family protein [Actinomadura rayongensis]MXQ63761.1 HIT domain-containing protein [Actinomadura rayongensis]